MNDALRVDQSPIAGWVVGNQLSKIWPNFPENVTHITIDLPATGIASVTFVCEMSAVQSAELLNCLSHYRLVDSGETSPVPVPDTGLFDEPHA